MLGDDVDVVGEVDPAPSWSGGTTSGPFELLALADGDACRVVAADFVTIDDGSGIVHLAPAFGEIDREVGDRRGPARC